MFFEEGYNYTYTGLSQSEQDFLISFLDLTKKVPWMHQMKNGSLSFGSSGIQPKILNFLTQHHVTVLSQLCQAIYQPRVLAGAVCRFSITCFL